jgi:hypothetical protein
MHTKSGRRPGKRDGAVGFHLAKVARPDERVGYFPDRCGGCQRGLRRADRVGEPVRRQAFDVPEMTVRATEHVLHAAKCTTCGAIIRAQPPA